jgi:hypothetical protein
MRQHRIGKTSAIKRCSELRIIERKNFKAKRGTRSDYQSFERFRRDLYGCGVNGATLAFSAGRALRKQWAKSNAKIRVTFGAGRKALDSFIRITVNGKRVLEGTV